MKCINCACKLREIDKFCSECGEITDSGRAVEALNKIGETPPDYIHAMSSAPGLGMSALDAYAGTIGWGLDPELVKLTDEHIRKE